MTPEQQLQTVLEESKKQYEQELRRKKQQDDKKRQDDENVARAIQASLDTKSEQDSKTSRDLEMQLKALRADIRSDREFEEVRAALYQSCGLTNPGNGNAEAVSQAQIIPLQRDEVEDRKLAIEAARQAAVDAVNRRTRSSGSPGSSAGAVADQRMGNLSLGLQRELYQEAAARDKLLKMLNDHARETGRPAVSGANLDKIVSMLRDTAGRRFN